MERGKMNKMYLVLGDWSDDGHGQYEKVLLQSNMPLIIIQEAYKDACALTGISFNDNENYTKIERDWKEEEKYQIAARYENSFVPKTCLAILESHGIQIKDWYEEEPSGDYGRDEDGNLMICQNDFVDLWVAFVKLCLPQDAILQRAPQKEEIPAINGYWNKNLNVECGYGLFS